MKTITNSTGSKAVNLYFKDGYIKCLYVDIYDGHQQVLDSKDYKNESMARKWANKKLGV